MPSKKPRIVIIISLAYSGTTWLSLVLSSHSRAMSLGAGDMLIERLNSKCGEFCGVHGRKCKFWPQFLQGREGDELFVDLMKYSGKDVFVINNPTRRFIDKYLNNESVELIFIHNVRDGIATLASAMKHHPERVDSVFQASCAWLYRGTKNLKKRLADLNREYLLIRYEDAVLDPLDFLDKAGAWIGIDYDTGSLEFWRYEHHIPSGNIGVMDMLRKLQGEKPQGTGVSRFYDDLYKHAMDGNKATELDDSWRELYSEIDLAAYDWVAGNLYEEYGYSRPSYSQEAYRQFLKQYNPPSTIQETVDSFPPWRKPDVSWYKNLMGLFRLKIKNLINA